MNRSKAFQSLAMHVASSKGFLGLVCISLLITLARCGLVPDTTTPASGTFGSVYVALKSNNCTECHVPGGAATVAGAQLDFTTQSTAYTTLLSKSVSATSSIGTCGSAKIVTAGDVSKSYLAAVLISSYSTSNFAGVTGCTPYSAHLTDTNMSAAEKTSVTDWIKNGALNN